MNETKIILDKFFPDEDRLVLIEGGETRHDTLTNSVNYINKIKDCENPIIIKHAAARIFVSTEMIRKCIDYTKKYGAAGPIIKSTDFILEVENNRVVNIPPRANVVHVQTPQGFRLAEYLETVDDLTEDEIKNVHDLISIYYLRGKDVYLFEGDKSNFKITTSIDVEIAKSFLLDD